MRALLVAAALLVTSPLAAQQTAATLTQQSADAALRVLNLAVARYSAGTGNADEVGTWGARWFQARKDTGLTGPALLAAAQEWLDKMRAFEAVAKSKVQSGLASQYDVELAGFYRLQAEAQVARLKP